jgi:hypothetical protein
VRVCIQQAREAGLSWEQVGEALGLAGTSRARGPSLGEAAFEYAADRPAFRASQPGTFAWTCPGCGETVHDRGPSRRSPAEDEPGHAGGCQRLGAAVAAWPARGD